MKNYVYNFGGGTADGDGKMKEVLGGKGAGLAEMCRAGVPVPPGFTISTEVCTIYFENGNAVPDDAQEAAWREKLVSLGYGVSPVMDRVYFHSIYFREPGGLLFEIATDPPGFTKDERLDELGSTLRLPPWMERARPQIERMLPEITLPAGPE